jgi:hypothetical protein
MPPAAVDLAIGLFRSARPLATEGLRQPLRGTLPSASLPLERYVPYTLYKLAVPARQVRTGNATAAAPVAHA